MKFFEGKNIKGKKELDSKKSGKKFKSNKETENFFNTFSGRLSIALILMSIALITVIGRVYYLQIVDNRWEKIGEAQYTSINKIKVKRGKIATDDGEVLAYDKENYAIILDPTIVQKQIVPKAKDKGSKKEEELEKEAQEKIDAARRVEKLFLILKKYIPEIDSEKYMKELDAKSKRNARYMKIKEIFGYDQKKAIEKELNDAGNKDVKKGVTFENIFTRTYIDNRAFQETVGFINNEKEGLYGIEKFYDSQLKGTEGVIRLFNKNNSTMASMDKSERLVEPKNGNSVILTLDSVLQYAMDEELKNTYNYYNASSTMGVLIEVETGKVLAMSSYPKADSNTKVKNRPITDLFEPGSIFKPVTASIGLETKVISPNTQIYSSGSIRVDDRTIRDHDGVPISGSLETIIAKSGNVAMVKIAQMIKNKIFYNYLMNIGLGSKTGIDTYSEMTQKLFPFKSLTAVKKSNVAFGQGIAMTQMQMLMALNTVINNGKLMKPYLVDRIEDSDGKIIKKNQPTVIKKVFSDEVSKANRRFMEAVVTRGTGQAAQIKGYRIGGKTGTAQKSGIGGYQKGRYFSSFFAFFPANNPKYAILVTINEPKRTGNYYGATVALPSVKNILSKLIEYKRISPDGEVGGKKDDENDEKKVAVKKVDINVVKEQFNKGIMPDLKNLSLREFLDVFPREKYPNLKINGSGAVVDQFPKAETKINRNTTINVAFK